MKIKNLQCIILIPISITTMLSAQSTDYKSLSKVNSNWVYLGLQSDRISNIAIDWSNPNVIYAGSRADYSSGKVGYIFKTTDGGVFWDTLVSGISVTDIDINPRDHNMVFVCCGVNLLTTQGILKTTDAGLNWIWADSGMTITWEVGPILLDFSPNLDSIMYVSVHGAHPGNLYKTTNYGISWQAIGNNTYLRDGVSTIAINPHNDNEIYCGTIWNGFHLRSSDQGNTWNTTNLSNVYASVVYNGFNQYDTTRIYASAGGMTTAGLFYSTNKGDDWNRIAEYLPYTGGTNDIKFVKRDTETQIFLLDSGLVFTGFNFDSLKLVDGISQFHPVWEFEVDTITNRLYIVSGGIYYSDLITGLADEEIKVVTKIEQSDVQNYPNPVNPTTNFVVKVSENGLVVLRVFDILGREVAILLNEEKVPGIYNISFNAINFPSGVYFYRLENNNIHISKKMIILK